MVGDRDLLELDAARRRGELAQSGRLRQGVALADEVDGRDHEAMSLVALVRERVVGTVRLFDEGERWRLTRMAVDRRFRGMGVGRILVERSHRRARSSGASQMVLSAQMSARDFYLRQGYEQQGGSYLDAGMLHVSMRRALDDG